MSVEDDIEPFPWGRIVEGFAWASLVVAFVIGQIAAQTDYESLLKAQIPDVEFERSTVSSEYPIVYNIKKNGEQLPEVVVMSEGIGYGGRSSLASKRSVLTKVHPCLKLFCLAIKKHLLSWSR